MELVDAKDLVKASGSSRNQEAAGKDADKMTLRCDFPDLCYTCGPTQLLPFGENSDRLAKSISQQLPFPPIPHSFNKEASPDAICGSW